MTRLDPSTYLDHLRRESARFGAVLAACDPAARVPSCPDWDAADLLWHLTTVQRFWAARVVDRPAGPEGHEDPARPRDHADLLREHGEAAAALADALEGVDPAAEAWTWHPTDHTVGFILRRQAHEALVHRLDAELAAGTPTELDARLAADGVHEVLDTMYGGSPPWGAFTPSEALLRVDCTDTGDSVWVRLGRFSGTDPASGTTYTDEADLQVVDPPGEGVEPDAVLDGPAGALDAWLWHRGGDDEVSTAGDPAVLAAFREVLAQPIE